MERRWRRYVAGEKWKRSVQPEHSECAVIGGARYKNPHLQLL